MKIFNQNTFFSVLEVVMASMAKEHGRELRNFHFNCLVDQIGDLKVHLRDRKVAVTDIQQIGNTASISGVCFDNQIGKVRRLLVVQRVIKEDDYGKIQIDELNRLNTISIPEKN